MRVAILDSDPRVCGPMSWMRHLAIGFTQLGHEVAIVSHTKSGRSRSSWGEVKWGTHWSVYSPDVTVKDENLIATLDDFDLVVLPEPRVPAADKESLKTSPLEIPVYVDALQRTKTPFIFALHGNDYDEKSTPYLGHLLDSDNWCETIISHSGRSTASNPVFASPAVNIVQSALPYRPSREVGAVRSVTNTVGTTGRFIFNKGPHLVALAASQLPAGTTVELWGSASTGLGASVTYETYKHLLPNAARYARYADQEEKRGQAGWTEHGNIIRPYLWDVRLTEGQLVRYLGNYTDAVSVAERLDVHVNLTGYKFSGGLVEYSTLEAMDAGSVCIVPSHCSAPWFDSVVVNLENPPGSPTAALKQPELLKSVAKEINYALEIAHPRTTSDKLDLRTMIENNRETLRDYNSPRKVAEKFIQGAFDK